MSRDVRQLANIFVNIRVKNQALQMKKQRRDTVEEDLIAGPLLQKEIYHHDFPNINSLPDQTHILVSIYKYRVVVGQFDTNEQVWDVVGDSFHSIEVYTARMATERALKVRSDSDILKAIEEGFPGPRTIDRWIEFCREKICDQTIVESGPGRDDLIKAFM